MVRCSAAEIGLSHSRDPSGIELLPAGGRGHEIPLNIFEPVPVARMDWFSRYQDNWRLLREAVNAVGAELEQWPYEDLDRDAEDQPMISRQVGGAVLQFWVDRWQKAPNGDLTICIDAKGLPTLLGVKPSYQFAKRPDGSVYYP